MVTEKRKAILWLIFSLSVTVVWPVSGISSMLHIWAPFVWASCLSMVLLSGARLKGVEHPHPCPEIFCFLSAHIPGLMFSTFLPSDTIASFDDLLLTFDGRFFAYSGEALVKLVQQHSSLSILLAVVYLGLPLAGTILYLGLPSTDIRRKYCVASFLGVSLVAFFRICPAAGPGFSLEPTVFPDAIPLLGSPHARIIPNLILNAIPSGHVAWSLLNLWFALRYCRKSIQVAMHVLCLLTCLATLGFGQHYMIDLIVAVPFTAILWASAHRQWYFAGTSLVTVLTWLVVLREGWALQLPPALVWLLVGITIALFTLYDGRSVDWIRRYRSGLPEERRESYPHEMSPQAHSVTLSKN